MPFSSAARRTATSFWKDSRCSADWNGVCFHQLDRFRKFLCIKFRFIKFWFVDSGGFPLANLRWRVWEGKNGWVKWSGKFLAGFEDFYEREIKIKSWWVNWRSFNDEFHPIRKNTTSKFDKGRNSLTKICKEPRQNSQKFPFGKHRSVLQLRKMASRYHCILQCKANRLP